MNHEAIYKLYPNVVIVREQTAYDAEGNVVKYNEKDVTTEGNKMSLREERNRRLAETDWWALSDLTITDEQKDYRQKLRNITENYTSLEDVVWPEKPE